MNKSAIFGRRQEPHTIVIARGGQIRHFTIRPWLAAFCGAVFLAAGVGYLAATSYLILRDDLINATMMRQAHVQHAYEDRIAALRTQVDRITSHRLLDQQFIETKITELADRQSTLAARSGALMPLIERAQEKGVGAGAALPDELPVPAARPGTSSPSLTQASLGANPSIDPIITGSAYAPEQTEEVYLPVARGTAGAMMLTEVDSTLSQIENEQLAQITALTRAAHTKRNDIIAAAKASGLQIASKPIEVTGTGGPFVPFADQNVDNAFEQSLTTLQEALNALDDTRGEVTAFPIAHPAPGKRMSSGFGKRRDPILGRSAFHAGVDFATPTGTPIRAPADGKVIRVGRVGGYGNLVELRHANGMTTRFAHLSRISVKKGQAVKAGQTIAKSGNTGRSTGPHLHYEIRANDKPIDPKRYLNAGSRLADHL